MAIEQGEYTPSKRSLARRAAEAFVSSRPGAWLFVNVTPPIDRTLIRLSGGRVTMGGRIVGLLRVRGAKSGVVRETPLVFTRDGERLILIASRGGDAKHPAWYRNVVANPEVKFSVRGDERSYRARTLEGDERQRAWHLACDRYAGYLVYQRRAGERRIPVVALEPADDTSDAAATAAGTA